MEIIPAAPIAQYDQSKRIVTTSTAIVMIQQIAARIMPLTRQTFSALFEIRFLGSTLPLLSKYL